MARKMKKMKYQAGGKWPHGNPYDWKRTKGTTIYTNVKTGENRTIQHGLIERAVAYLDEKKRKKAIEDKNRFKIWPKKLSEAVTKTDDRQLSPMIDKEKTALAPLKTAASLRKSYKHGGKTKRRHSGGLEQHD